jgi:hypothetical protein
MPTTPNTSSFLRAALLALLPLTASAQLSTSPALVEAKTTGPSPVTRLRLQATGGLYLGGTYDGGTSFTDVPAEGAGTRLIWYPNKAAFRAGYVNGTQWDDANIGDYSNAAGYNARASGNYATAFGKDVVAAQTTSTALGEFCTAPGVASVALGYYAHTNARDGSFVFADRSVLDDGDIFTDEAFRAQVANSANWRVSGGFRIFTNSTRTAGVTIQQGNATSNWGQSNAVISTSTGAYLSTTGVWTNVSDRRKKHRFEAVSGEDVLARLRQVPITRWRYKADAAQAAHLGPMAQDFRRAFGLGPDSVSIGTIDADGVALAAAQALDARTRQHQTELAALRAENARLSAQNAAFQARLTALERRATGPATAGLPLSAGLWVAGAGLLGALLLRRRQPARA